jgi:bacterioferritin (cytochrome b1)
MANHTLTRLTAAEILTGLAQALAAELQAVADYDAHARVSTQPDIREALERLRDVEAEHALRLTARISALGAAPISQAAQPQPAGNTLEARLTCDLEGEQWAIVNYARLLAGIMDDDETAELMTELLLDEIRHARWLKSALRAHQAGGPTG